MTRWTDASIAKAFWHQRDQFGASAFTEKVLLEAADFDAESPAVVHTIPEKVTTPIRRVYIEPESERGYCPKCTGNVWVGSHCAGLECPMRPCAHPGCGTPTTPGPCAFDACPRK